MNKILPALLSGIFLMLFACERKLDENPVDFGFDFQPLAIGNFWIYEVDQTVYFGENDSEDYEFYVRDYIYTSYINEENEQVFVIERSKSDDLTSWEPLENYTLILRQQVLIRTSQNQSTVALVFPPKDGVSWNSASYINSPEDNFVINYPSGNSNLLEVNQSEEDDLVTYRDIRYEIFEKGIGLIEDYEEVLTYCSRNDCLGDQLIDGGSKTHLKITEYGQF
ncbi:hypothetical protein JYB64_05590 [Algoriphagus aestuarii]|nr:hypothetical protein [Algoriphagus aestuarii]